MVRTRESRPVWAWLLAATTALLGALLVWTYTSAVAGAGTGGKNYDRIYRTHQSIVFAGPDAWRGHYNAGTAHAMRSELPEARKSLTTALGRVPEASPNVSGSKVGSDECLVRMNLSLVLETEALELAEKAGEDRAGLDTAAKVMAKAAETSKVCTTDGQGGEGSTSEEDITHQRQNSEAERMKTPQEPPQDEQNDPNPGDDPNSGDESKPDPNEDPVPSPTPTLDDKQKQLEENQRMSEDEVRQREQRLGEGFGSGEAW